MSDYRKSVSKGFGLGLRQSDRKHSDRRNAHCPRPDATEERDVRLVRASGQLKTREDRRGIEKYLFIFYLFYFYYKSN